MRPVPIKRREKDMDEKRPGVSSLETEQGHRRDYKSLTFPVRKTFSNGAGFTLLELMLTAVILIGVLMALVGVPIYCFNLAETNYNTANAYNNAREQIESIFSAVGNIVEDNTTFTLLNPEGKGRIEITEVSPDVFQVRVVVCWKQRGGRIIGEDSNLNGVLDSGEDLDGDGALDSPCEIITLMTKT